MNGERGEAMIGGAAIPEFSHWAIWLSMISQRCHHIVQLFESDESATECDFVIVDRIGEFGDFRTS